MNKKVTVVMPSYNAEKYIDKAIRSVINQTYKEWNLFVIDDGSSDDTFLIAENIAKNDERIVVLKNERNLGVAKTRNKGISLSKGEYIAFLDSDDVWHADKLEKQIALLEKENADFAYCSYSIIDALGNKVKKDYYVPKEVFLDDILKENVIACSSIVVSSEIAKKVGFDENFYQEDYVFNINVLKNKFKVVGCEDICLDWRYIENSRSYNKLKSAKNRWMIYRKYLKLPFWKSLWYFGNYAVAGFRKYFIK